MRPKTTSNVQEIGDHLSLYLHTIQQLTGMLDRENALLLFEASEVEVLRNTAMQDAKMALYNRVETLARILTQTLRVGSADDVATIRCALGPLDGFRRSLRLNSALLEVCIERQERRIARIMQLIEANEAAPCH